MTRTWCHRPESGSTPAASAGRRPARTIDDLPVPPSPTTASSGARTNRASASATSRSRPWNISAWPTSNRPGPAYGHCPDGLGARQQRAGPVPDVREVEDAPDDLRLGGLEPLARALGIGDGAIDAPPGPLECPLAGVAVHAGRHPARVDHRGGGRRGGRRRRVGPHDLGDRLIVQSGQHELGHTVQVADPDRVAAGHQDDHGVAAGRAHKRGGGHQILVRGLVEIVEHDRR